MTLAMWMQCAALAAALGTSSLTLAQTAPGVPRPGAVESTPLAPPGATPAAPTSPQSAAPSTPPAPAQAQSAEPAAPSAAGPPTPATAARPTLIPDPGDAADVSEVMLPAKPTVVISGTSSSDEGFATLRRAFGKLEEELGRAGIAPAGRPFAVFQTFNQDGSFNYDAMIPIERAPEGRTLLTNEIRFGTTPSGRALRFTHKGSYEDVESTYDMIEVYLEAKGIVVQDPIIEEFVNDPKDAADAELELNIFVQPK
jgi:effector-binding domain-containing protein